MSRPDTAAQAIEWANTPRTCWYASSSGRIELACAGITENEA